ncbi:MAG: RNA polymerase sigma factor [Tissierellaceae bacterium]|nr:RNA polymerase sigma factor [Tissierellaceae bacterium]
METENLLIEKSKSGHEDSFSELINIYKNYIFAIILNFIKDYNEVENVAQEVCLQIFVSLPSYDQQNFKGWIGRIATNKSIDWIRKKKAKFNDEVLEDGVLESIPVEQKDNPETLLVEQEKREELLKALNSIPEIYRDTLKKFYFQEKSYEEIAKEENVTTKTIASRLYRAKILLKEKWREEDEAL